MTKKSRILKTDAVSYVYCLLRSLQLIKEVKDAPVQNKAKPQHRGQHPYSFRTVSGFFSVPHY